MKKNISTVLGTFFPKVIPSLTSIAMIESPILYNIIDDIGEIGYTIKHLFDDTGIWCVKIGNAAVGVFDKLTYSATDILTSDSDSAIFSDFWKVINPVSRVFCIIASTLMILFFIGSLVSEAWETRHEFDIWGFVKSLVKLIVCVVILNNSIPIVKGIFSAGARMARIVSLRSSGVGDTLRISKASSNYIAFGVSGLSGLFVFFVYLIGSLVVITSAVMITLEIYQRVFKIYILIPFSCFSFSTFAMSKNGHGSEVFSGYLKSIIQTSLEAVVIILALSFCSSLIANDTTMNNLFSGYDATDYISITVNNPEEYQYAKNYYRNKQYADNNGKSMEEVKSNGISDAFKQSVSNAFSGDLTYYENEKIGELNQDGDRSITYPTTYSIFPSVSWKDAFMILLQFVFPCILCAGVVKSADRYSGIVVGRG